MISREATEAFNTRMVLNPNSIKKMTPAQRDAVIAWGSNAEALLKNKDLAHFIHEFKFDMCDQLTNVLGHAPDDNTRRIAISNQLAGIDQFVSMLQRAIYYKNQAVNHKPMDPANIES